MVISLMRCRWNCLEYLLKSHRSTFLTLRSQTFPSDWRIVKPAHMWWCVVSEIYGCSWQINCAQHSTLESRSSSRTWICTPQAKFAFFPFFSLVSGYVKMSAAVETLNKLGRSILMGKQGKGKMSPNKFVSENYFD